MTGVEEKVPRREGDRGQLDESRSDPDSWVSKRERRERDPDLNSLLSSLLLTERKASSKGKKEKVLAARSRFLVLKTNKNYGGLKDDKISKLRFGVLILYNQTELFGTSHGRPFTEQPRLNFRLGRG